MTDKPFVPRSAQVPESDWMKEHIGEYVRTLGHVWRCGDDDCNCWQAQVSDIYTNRVLKAAFCFKGVWEGGYYSSDSRLDPARLAENDLIAYRQRLKKEDPEFEAQITWQDGVDYDRNIALEDDPIVW